MTTDATPAADAATPESATPAPPRDFPWMRAATERNMKPVIGPQGLRIRDVDQGSYGQIPEHWPYKTDMPRGARMGDFVGLEASYSLYDKAEVWSENAADLYEDAIRDRWISATDVPWDTLVPQPELVERALCQLLTELSEASFVCLQVYSGWLERISYGFYEVKSFLATQIYDSGRHVEAFRKRALANGGGLGIQSPGIYHRALTSAMRLTELVIAQNIVWDTYQLVVLSALREQAATEADRVLCSLVMRDLWRHVDYGTGHVRFLLQSQPEKLDQVHTWLSRAELMLTAQARFDTPFNEALILLLGENVADGRRRLGQLRRDFVAAYLHRLETAGVYTRIEKLVPDLKLFVPEGLATPNSTTMEPVLADPLRRELQPA